MTVTVKVVTPPLQPLIVAVALMIVVNGTRPALVVTNGGIIPLPEVPNPISLLLVQLNIGLPPDVEVENRIPAWLAPVQIVWFVIAVTTGVGFTVIVKFMGIPSQSDAPIGK